MDKDSGEDGPAPAVDRTNMILISSGTILYLKACKAKEAGFSLMSDVGIGRWAAVRL